eukprot:12923926-Prorocentrum_lima.AAC.1
MHAPVWRGVQARGLRWRWWCSQCRLGWCPRLWVGKQSRLHVAAQGAAKRKVTRWTAYEEQPATKCRAPHSTTGT